MAVQKSMPILIVDDYNTTIRIVRNLLRGLGFSQIDEASDGRTALTKLRNKKYGLVISDWNLAPMSGLEFLQQMRADARFAGTPLVMVGEDAQHAGGAVSLASPLTAQGLKSKLEGVLGAF